MIFNPCIEHDGEVPKSITICAWKGVAHEKCRSNDLHQSDHCATPTCIVSDTSNGENTEDDRVRPVPGCLLACSCTAAMGKLDLRSFPQFGDYGVWSVKYGAIYSAGKIEMWSRCSGDYPYEARI